MSAVEFAALPPDGRFERYYEVRAALRSNPGEWARVAVAASASTATAMRRRPSWNGFEIRTRKSPDVAGRHDIWARFVGDEGGVS